jgi:hypothetical protein
MIINRKRPNVLMVQTKSESIYLYPGLNSNVPEEMRDHPTVKEQVELGYMEIVESKAKDVEEKRGVLVDDVDEEVIETILKTEAKGAAKLVKSVLKLVTLESLKAKETRSSVLKVISAQIDVIRK